MMKRPQLTIEVTGGRNLGRCYNATYYRVTSLSKLTRERIDALRKAGFLGYGQEFSITSKCDGTELPAGIDEEQPLDESGNPRINHYTKQPCSPVRQPYFIYNTEDRVDSSD